MNKQIRLGVVLQYVQMGLSIVISLVYTPMMLRILGQSEYGIYNLSSSIISYLSLLSLGFGASYVHFYSIYKKDNLEDKIRQLNGMYLTVFTVMGIVSFAAGMYLASNVEIMFNSTYTAHDLEIARVLMIFLSFNIAISFPASIFVSYITSQEKFIFQKLVNIVKTILSPCLCIALLLCGYGSIGMVIVTTVCIVFADMLNMLYCMLKLKMGFSFRGFNGSLFKQVAIFSCFIAINQVVDQINWQTDKVILGKMVGASAVAIYAVASNINTMYLSFSGAISNVFIPRINKIVAEGGQMLDRKLTEIMTKIGRIQYFVMMLILTGFILFGKFFIVLWAGEDYIMSYYVILLLICPVTVPQIQNIGIEIQRAKNLHQFRSIIYMIMALLNVVISIVLCNWFGVLGTAAGTAISLIIANIIIMNIFYHKKCRIDMIYFWKSIFLMSKGLIAPIIIGIAMNYFIQDTGFAVFAVKVVIYGVVYCASMWLFGMNSEEKALVRGPLGKILGRRKSQS